MIKRFKLMIILMLGCFIAFAWQDVSAQSVTGAGMTFAKTRTKLEQFFTTVVALNDDPGTSTATYNSAGESTDVAGAINVTRYSKDITAEWHVPTLGSTGIDLIFLGRFGTDTGWVSLETESITSTTGANSHGSISIQEKPKWFKVSRQATGTDGPDDISLWVRGTGWAE